MHPVIRLVCFLVFAAFLTREGAGGIALGALLVVGLFVVVRGAGLGPAWRMLRRMRWLFLSILIVYFWFTPGTPLWHAVGWAAPSREGAVAGLERIAALALMVFGVSLLGATTPRAGLLGALHWASTPARWVGLAPERLALRIVLVMDAVTELRPVLAAQRAALGGASGRGLINRLGDAAAGLLGETLARAERAPCEPTPVPRLAAPPPWQWLLPLALGLAFWILP